MKIRVAICVSDTVYSKKISSYFAAHYGDSVETYTFSDDGLLQKYLETHVMDVLMVDDNFDFRKVSEWSEMLVFYLTQTSNFEVDSDGHIPICKYQKASATYQEILHWCAKKNEFSVRKGNNKTIFISFADIAGGAGASTISTAFSIYLARQGRKVLFLNMEEFGDTSVLLGEGGKYSFEEILLALKTKNGNLSMKLQSAVSKSEDEVYFYSCCPNPVDYSEMEADEAKRLLETIASMDYQYVIIDFHMDLSDRTIEILNSSDRIVMVSDGSTLSKKKFDRIRAALRILDGRKRTRNIDKLCIFNNKIEKGRGIDISSDGVPNVGSITMIDKDRPVDLAKYIAGKVDAFSELG